MTRTEHSRRKRRILLWLLIAAAVIAVGVLWFRWQQRAIESTVTQVELSALPEAFDGFRIVHLSDLHGHEYGENSGELLARVREQSPDLIVMTGDMVDRENQMEMIPALAKGLAAIAPTYYVTGNH